MEKNTSFIKMLDKGDVRGVDMYFQLIQNQPISITSRVYIALYYLQVCQQREMIRCFTKHRPEETGIALFTCFFHKGWVEWYVEEIQQLPLEEATEIVNVVSASMQIDEYRNFCHVFQDEFDLHDTTNTRSLITKEAIN